jgi:ribosomal protein S18 acetylase RimI-like enzyme
MGGMDIIGVEPDYRRRGIGDRLTSFALDHVQGSGMDISMVETGEDPGHEPARATYVASSQRASIECRRQP